MKWNTVSILKTKKDPHQHSFAFSMLDKYLPNKRARFFFDIINEAR